MAGDIRVLELEFAKNPTLDACIPLCEAYLGNKRYMEAMVVCKKGIKQAPNDPRGSVLLARVYLDQGKVPKAEQELSGAMQKFPGNPLVLELTGQVLLQQGRNQEAAQFLQQAVGADPTLQRARALLQQLGLAAPQAARPAAPAMPQPGVQQRPGQPGMPMPQPGVQQRPGQPGMPMPQPGVQQRPGQPGMPMPQPGMQQRPGQPGMPMPQLGTQQPPPGMPQPGWGPGSAGPGFGPPPVPGQQQMAAPQAAPPVGPKLEHVSDFFAEETLGFQNDASNIETAGPGRLTILGFVPKTTGSIKKTIFVALGLLAVCSVVVVAQYIQGKNLREINRLYGQLKSAMDEDKYVRYHDALKVGQEILRINDSHNQTLSAMAYAEAVLAETHKEDGAVERAKGYLQRAIASSDESTEYRVAAQALLAYVAGEYDRGIAEVKKVQDAGGSGVLFEIEMYRLMNAAHPSDKETARQLQRVLETLTFHARGFTMLGWTYYGVEDWSKADKYFDEAQKNSKDHPIALLGQALTDLDRNIGIEERQKEIGERIKKVHALPKDELSRPVQALASFARAQLYQWQGKRAEAEADYKQAFSLDPSNPVFHVARARSFMNLNRWGEAINSLREAVKLDANNPRLYKKLCKAQTQSGDTRSAAASCKRAEELAGGKEWEARFLDCERLRAEKAFAESIKCYLAIPMEAGPDIYAQARIAVSKTQRAEKKFNDAAQSLTEFLEKMPAGVLPPRIAESWCELGQAYEAGKKLDQALDCYRFGNEQYPYWGPCHAYACLAGKPADPDTRNECELYLKVDPRGEFIDKVNAKLKRLK